MKENTRDANALHTQRRREWHHASDPPEEIYSKNRIRRSTFRKRTRKQRLRNPTLQTSD